MSKPIFYHSTSAPHYWSTEQVMAELNISRPTAYKLMHASGAESRTMRHLRVYVPDFLAFLNRKGVDRDAS